MLRIAALCLLLLPAFPAAAAEKFFDFFGARVNERPAGFSSVLHGSGAPGDWRIVMDEVPPLLGSLGPGASSRGRRAVLAQLSQDPTDERFPMFIYDDESFSDFTLTTRFKLVSGTKERMAGIAFRFQDERNYYYIRASGLGSTFYFLKVVNGIRSAPIGNKMEIPSGVWHELTIECKGTQIRALFNGKEALPLLDDKSLGTGRIGFWTKSDSVVHFADTRLVYKPREILAQVLVREAMRQNPRLLGLKIYAPVTNPPPGSLRVVATSEPEELGQPAPQDAGQVLEERGYFYGRGNGVVSVTLPLRDSNGDKVAAVRVLMKTFTGQTEKNAVVRATPIVKSMEARIRSLPDLLQ